MASGQAENADRLDAKEKPLISLGGRVAAFFAAFLLFAMLAALGIFLTRAAENVAVFWPANAAVVALGLASGRRHWAPILAGSFCANFLIQALMGDPWLICLGVPLANLIEIGLMVFGLHRLGIGFGSIDSPAPALHFIGALMVAAIPSAVIGSASLVWIYGVDFVTTGFVWWVADLTSCLIVLLPLLSPWPRQRKQRRKITKAGVAETLAGVAFAVAGHVAFSTLDLPAAAAIILPLLWIAMRCGVFATALGCTGLILFEILLVVMDAFPTIVPGQSVRDAIFQLQTLSVVMALPAYLAATAIHAQRIANASLAEKEQEAKQKKALLEDTLASMNQGISCFDSNLGLTVWNAQYATMYGMQPEHLCEGMNFLDLLNSQKARGNFEGNPEELIDKIRQHISKGLEFRTETEMGSGRIIHTIHAPSPGGGWIGTHEDVTESRREADRVMNQALHDPLTGLPNRRYFDQKIARLKHDEDRAEQEGIAMLNVDLDHFKQINDTLGHDAGDAMLKHAAKVLRSALRDSDFVARLGGDEFVVICPVLGNTQFLADLATRLVTAMQVPVTYKNSTCKMGISIGIACGKGSKIDFLGMMKQADDALYQAKRLGRSCFVASGLPELKAAS